jgi:two-component system cell cycle response regulator DivK
MSGPSGPADPRGQEAPGLVLVVDDDVDSQDINRLSLEYAGYEVLQAWDGERALRLARERLPRIILMDIVMPKISGWEVTRSLKDDPRTAGIPIVALTAHPRAEGVATVSARDFAGYLLKPVEPRLVLRMIASIIGPGGGSGR